MRENLLARENRDIMTKGVITTERTTPLREVLELMRSRGIGSVVVTDAGRLCGIFTERDILTRLLAGPMDLESTPISEVMTRDPEALPPTAAVVWALNRMAVGGFRHIPIVDDENRPIGMVSARDIVEMVGEYFPEEVYNLPPNPVTYLPEDGG